MERAKDRKFCKKTGLYYEPHYHALYSPGNCRWANWKEQGNNRRTCHYIKIGKVKKSITEWAELFGISPDTALGRYSKGLSIEEIFYDGRLQI